MVIGIIGAGASGMAAAISASANPDVQVVLFERQARVGRKLQATGNGRCNLSNLNCDLIHYHGEDFLFAGNALKTYDPQNTLQWFSDLGLYTVAEASGKVYPYSDQANSVVDMLRFALVKENIQLLTGCEIQKIRHIGDDFEITDGETNWQCQKLIVACGGLAGTKLGGSMSGYKLLNKLGHKSTKLRPSLVQLKCAWGGVEALKGVRSNCHVQILCNGNFHAESTGELQFTQYGLSGPVIFECSRDVCAIKGTWVARLDFLPDLTSAELLQLLEHRAKLNLPADEFLTGILHNRLGRVLLKAAGVNRINTAGLESIVQCIKCFELMLTEPMGMDCAQVTAGGVCTDQFDPETMESKLIPGLYACGEVLDIDGDCGGYNLQWAWSSGRLAGMNAGKDAQ